MIETQHPNNHAEAADTIAQLLLKVHLAGHGETLSHLHRVAHYSTFIAQHLQWTPPQLSCLQTAALLHDIGKINVPLNLLNAPRKLTPDEFQIVQRHTTFGAQIIASSSQNPTPCLLAAHTVALTHHEKWDGSGYPNKLREHQIPEIGRIVAIADCFDALTFVRPYKPAWPFQKTIQFMHDQAGKAFDPSLIAILLDHQQELHNAYLRYTSQHHNTLCTPC